MLVDYRIREILIIIKNYRVLNGNKSKSEEINTINPKEIVDLTSKKEKTREELRSKNSGEEGDRGGRGGGKSKDESIDI